MRKSSSILVILYSVDVDVVESDEFPAFSLSLELANQKRQELIEQVAEVDDEIAELFLNDVLSLNAQLVPAI
jgi:elongation factor G